MKIEGKPIATFVNNEHPGIIGLGVLA